jgi:hypothetical protein
MRAKLGPRSRAVTARAAHAGAGGSKVSLGGQSASERREALRAAARAANALL